VENIPVDILQTVVPHPANQEPGADVRILFLIERALTLTTSVNVEGSEVTWEFTTVLSNEAPLRELFLLSALHIEPPDLVASKFEPIHVVCQIEHQMVLLRVLLEKLTLRH